MIEADFLTRTRTSYDAIAVGYGELARDEMDRKPLDRAMAGAFADLVRGRGPVADVGSGTPPSTSPTSCCPGRWRNSTGSWRPAGTRCWPSRSATSRCT
ncbi:hypothetical protein ACFWYW_51285 [Nonomuraea sp. NPDC059023]|uniref:hypothetical protein n=1 Tax=unclassified Nonomuraea TaxID=2593643 RepID=UPI0036937300